MKITKTHLRKRWKDDDFISNFSLPLKESMQSWERKKKLIHLDSNKINDIDLRGISNDELWFMPDFYKTNNVNIDFSYGKGALNFSHGDYKNINFEEFNFDRASGFRKSNIINGNFIKSKLIFDSDDTTFMDCNFSESKFKGGHKEYGFRRCKFINCNFNLAQWNNTYFLACWFENCTFTDFNISNSGIRGFKVDMLTPQVNSIFVDCDIDGLVEKTFSKK